eukprot:1986663-Alexandrium_andersonii.AAC.1
MDVGYGLRITDYGLRKRNSARDEGFGSWLRITGMVSGMGAMDVGCGYGLRKWITDADFGYE